MTIIPESDSERGWRLLLYVLAAATALIYLYNAFFEPGTLAYAPFTIQDDARQFLSWMSRLGEANAMQGDLIASYWQSVCPLLYRSIFGAAHAVGLEPNVFARLLPVALLFLSAWMAWRGGVQISKKTVNAFRAPPFAASVWSYRA